MSRRAKVLWSIAGIIVVLWITSNPADAADSVGIILDKLKDMGNSVIEFVKGVFNS